MFSDKLLVNFYIRLLILLQTCHIFYSKLDLALEPITDFIGIAHSFHPDNDCFCVSDLLQVSFLFVKKVLLPSVSIILLIRLNSLESIRLRGHWLEILELLYHLDVFDRWIHILLFFNVVARIYRCEIFWIDDKTRGWYLAFLRGRYLPGIWVKIFVIDLWQCRKWHPSDIVLKVI